MKKRINCRVVMRRRKRSSVRREMRRVRRCPPTDAPEMSATLVLSSCARTTTLTSGNPSRTCTPGCDCTKAASISVTAVEGSLRNPMTERLGCPVGSSRERDA